MNEIMRILVVEDNPADVDFIQETLLDSGPLRFHIESVSRLSSAISRLERKGVDIVLLDLGLPDSQGLQTFHRLREAAPDVPVIVLTGTDNDELAVAAVRDGAQDYLVKGQFSGGLLVRASRYALERQKAAVALSLAHQRLKRFVDANIVGVVIADAGGAIIEANDYYLRLIGFTRQELEQGKVDWRAITPPAWLPVDEQAIRELRERGICTPYEKEYLRRDGTRVPVFLANAMLPGPGEQIAAFVLDLTERKRLEQERAALEAQIHQQQRLEAIGTLAGGVAHEINNPINGIMNYAQLIQDRLPAESPLREYTGEILDETQRIATIVSNLLTFSQVGKQAHSPARIQDIIESTLSLIRTIIRHDQITLNVHVSPGLPNLRCRSQQLKQVLMNLLTNARDALNKRYSGYAPDKVLSVEARQIEKEGRPWIRVTVEDHGTGITPEVRERMFDPFFTTKPRDKGTGLGLAISHGIVKEHHGELTAESEPGRFTRIHVDLPVNQEENA